MKISGFSIIRNGETFDYPYLESFRSLLPLVDELVLNVGIGTDTTLEVLQKFAREEGQGKVQIFESVWPLDDPEKRKGGAILADQTNLALQRCTGDWCIYLQADEVLHEDDSVVLRETMELYQDHPDVDALLFQYRHLYGSYEIEQRSRSAYRREVRAFKLSADAVSVGDAQSFLKSDGGKLRALLTPCRVFHYGWVRNPNAMKEKTYFMDSLYHGDKTRTSNSGEVLPVTGLNYMYKRIIGLRPLEDTHPKVMHARIESKGWKWDLANSPLEWSLKDSKKLLLDNLEKFTNVRLFEHRKYSLLKRVSLLDSPAPILGSLFVSTFNMPRHLDLVLSALSRQSVARLEILLCDDGSGAETKAVVEKHKKAFGDRLIHLWQENKGFRKCKILNEALRKSKGRVCIFLDGDCIPHKHFIEDHLTTITPGTYGAGRRIDLGESFSDSITAEKITSGLFDGPNFTLLKKTFEKECDNFHRTFRVLSKPLRRILKMNRVADLKGCNYSVSRHALLSINGFDEAYEGYGREDTDVEIRLKNLGLRIRSLKGMAIQFHVWHPRREFTPTNETLLEEAIRTKKTWCEKGVAQAP